MSFSRRTVHAALAPAVSALAAALALSSGAASAQDFNDLRIERLAAGHRFTEGPTWTPDGKLLYTDIPPNLIMVWTPGSKPTEFRKDTNGANGLTFDTKGNLYICEGTGRKVVRVDRKGKVETLASEYNGKKFNAPNDIVVRKDGHIYFTDPAFGNAMDRRELDFFGVYHITPKGDLAVFAKPKGRPNGIALSPNGRILYVTNTDERSVYAYDVDKNGIPSNERVLVQGIEGGPDGMTVDEKGNLYVTAAGVFIYTPAGKLIRKIELADPATNCKFGETDLQSLFVTSQASVFRIRMPVKGSVQYLDAN